MLRHNNKLGNDGPARIELKDIEMSVFQATVDFLNCGHLEPDTNGTQGPQNCARVGRQQLLW